MKNVDEAAEKMQPLPPAPPQWPRLPNNCSRLPIYVHLGSCTLRSVDSQMQTSVFQLTRLITQFLVVFTVLGKGVKSKVRRALPNQPGLGYK